MRKIILSLAALSLTINCLAAHMGSYDFVIDTIAYRINEDLVSVNVVAGNQTYDEWGITDVVIPDTVVYNGAKYAVAEVNANAFGYCTKIVSVNVNAQKIASRAFISINKLKTVVLGDNVRTIGAEAFSSCTKLEALDLPAHLETMGKDMIADCPLIDKLYIPASVCMVGSQKYFAHMNSIVVSPDNEYYNSNNECNAIIETSTKKLVAACPLTILPDDVEIIGEDAYRWSELTELTLPSSVTAILASAFRNSSIERIVLPNSLTSIGEEAFYECKYLVSANLPSHLKTIGSHAFTFCTQLQSVELPSSLWSIGDFAYAGTGIQSVHIPSTMTSIGNGVFSGCANLKCVTFDSEFQLEELPESMFGACNSVQWIDLPSSINVIGLHSIPYVSSLILPDQITCISREALSKDLYVPKSSALSSINLTQTSSNEKNYSWLTFDCDLPRIQQHASSYKGWLTINVTFGSNVQNIEDAKIYFYNNQGPRYLYCYGETPPTCNDYTFMASNNTDLSNVQLHVPAVAVEAYRNDPVWSRFTRIFGDAVMPESLSLGKEVIHLKPGQTANVSAQLLPEDANGGEFVFACIDANIATVDDSQQIQALKLGRTTLHCTYGALHAFCEIVVSNEDFNETMDLNGDGRVDISDVNLLINMMLGKTEPTATGDVNGDGVVDVSDVNIVINAMLGK